MSNTEKVLDEMFRNAKEEELRFQEQDIETDIMLRNSLEKNGYIAVHDMSNFNLW